MKEKTKVYFILPTLFAGGAERVVSFVSQNLNKTKFDVVLVVIGYEKNSKYIVNQIPTVFLNKERVLNSVFLLIKLLYKERPHIVMSSISHLNIIMGLISILFPKMKFIGRQATINKVASHYRNTNRKTLFKKGRSYLYNLGMEKLDHIICQSLDMKKDFMESYDIAETKIKIIHNPITQVTNIKKVNSKENKAKQFITVGRLGKIKGHLRILNILSKLETPFKYTIIGDGALKETIFDRAKELNLIDKIEHIDHTNNVSKYLIENDMFLQGSYSEGFPNALLESCCVGTPVIAFNVPGGTKEIVEHSVNGFLVEDEESYLKCLKDKRDWNPEVIIDSVHKKFSSEKIIKEYESFFHDIIKSNKN